MLAIIGVVSFGHFIGMMDAPSIGFILGIIAGVIFVGYLCIKGVIAQQRKYNQLKRQHGKDWWKYIK